jgi:hypothetical protein
MPRDGAIMFGDPVAKLDVLHVDCDKCGRKGRHSVEKSSMNLACSLHSLKQFT